MQSSSTMEPEDMSLPYTYDEQKLIVDYIVQNDAISRIKGDRIWKEMEAAKITNRTWQSLKQHFRKTIITQLHFPRYGLDQETIQRFRDAFSTSELKRKNTSQETEASPPHLRRIGSVREFPTGEGSSAAAPGESSSTAAPGESSSTEAPEAPGVEEGNSGDTAVGVEATEENQAPGSSGEQPSTSRADQPIEESSTPDTVESDPSLILIEPSSSEIIEVPSTSDVEQSPSVQTIHTSDSEPTCVGSADLEFKVIFGPRDLKSTSDTDTSHPQTSSVVTIAERLLVTHRSMYDQPDAEDDIIDEPTHPLERQGPSANRIESPLAQLRSSSEAELEGNRRFAHPIEPRVEEVIVIDDDEDSDCVEVPQ